MDFRIKSKEKKIKDSLDLALKLSLTEQEKQIHAIFKDYLENDIVFSKANKTADLTKEQKIDPKAPDSEKIKKGCELLSIYCQEELEYRISAMQDSYRAFNEIFNISEEHIFREILQKGGLVKEEGEIEEFLKEKKEVVTTKFSRKGAKKSGRKK